MKKTVLIAAVAAFAAAYPAAAGAVSFHGTVVGKQATRHVLVVASSSGLARTVHTASRARVGAVVSVTASARRDGTFAASRVAVVGRTHHARIHGVIVRRVGSWTFLAAGRSVLAVRSRARGAASVGTGPAAGTVANVSASITPQGTLNATSITPAGQAGQIVIQATVSALTPPTATTPGSITLTVNGQSFTVALPAGTTPPAGLAQGSTVTLTLTFGGGQPSATNAGDDDDQGDDNDDNEDDDGGDD